MGRHVCSTALALGVWLLSGGVLAEAGGPSFEERVAAQAAIERVYYSHRLGVQRPFDVAVPPAVIEGKVRRYLKQSVALEELWGTPVTAEMLRRELERMARQTRMPERLRELYAALDNDPVLVQECLVRPVLVDRLSRSFFAGDERIHAAEQARAQAQPEDSVVDERTWDEWWAEVAPRFDEGLVSVVADPAVELPSSLGQAERAWDDPSDPPGGPSGQGSAPCVPDDTWDNGSLDGDGVPRERTSHTAVWTGSQMVVWGGTYDQTGGRYDPATDTWTPTSTTNAPSARSGHTAVWTGSQMVVWGGTSDRTGGRYDPVADTWTPTSTSLAPGARGGHSAVWTGSRMVVWGGRKPGTSVDTDTGGQYDPVLDTWTAMSTTGAPSPRVVHTAVWTGTRMIVWGGFSAGTYAQTGGLYDPITDTWTPTSTTNAPSPRTYHTAVWTGTRMIVWGGFSAGTYAQTGGLYDPITDTWTPTSTTNAPSPRTRHTAVWTGNLVVVWGGGTGPYTYADTGGRYDPAADAWSSTSQVNSPSARSGHSAVWTGDLMVVWGGHTQAEGAFSTGGRYDPALDSWTPTFTTGAPVSHGATLAIWTGSLMLVWERPGGEAYIPRSLARYDPATDAWTPGSLTGAPGGGGTAVWTGSLMIVWGGGDPWLQHQTGGRYDPVTDTWTPTATSGAPSGRAGHTAVWTGSHMIVWGGFRGYGGIAYLDSGGRYDPATDTWAPTSVTGAPSARSDHTAVWTGSHMIIWGGSGDDWADGGGRYDPATDTWAPVSVTGAPSPRWGHGAVWTGNRMLVWGGYGPPAGNLESGGRYDPATDTWWPTSTTDAPSARRGHTAVWTGDVMVVWGGTGDQTGGRYDPATDTWIPTSTVSAPSARAYHAAVWTGSFMLVWAGWGAYAEPVSNGGRYALGHASDDDGDGASECGGDCNDFLAAVHPGAAEVCDGLDNDCDLSTSELADTDGDGPSACEGDCVPGDAGVFAEPAEVAGLRVDADQVTLLWQSAAPGAGSATVHDVARGAIGGYPVGSGASESCVAAGISGTTATDPEYPGSGSGVWYLVRGRNVCGAGTYGSGSGAERTTTTCP